MRIRRWGKTEFYKTKSITRKILGDGNGTGVPCVSCVVDNDGLKTRLGAIKLNGTPFQKDIGYAYFIHKGGYFAACTDDGLYALPIDDFSTGNKISDDVMSPVAVVEDIVGEEHTTVFVLQSSACVVYGGTVVKYDLPVNVKDACLHYERLFYVDNDNPYRVGWSKHGVEDWGSGIDGAGYLDLHSYGGKALRVLSVKDKLVVIRESAVNVIYALGTPEHFRLDEKRTFSGRVVADSCCANGSCVYFATDDGLFKFCEGKVSKLPNLFVNDLYGVKKGVASEDVYVLSCSSKTYGHDVSFVYDLQCEMGYYVLTKADFIFVSDAIYLMSEGYLYKLGCDFNGNGTWFTKTLNFGTAKRKVIKLLKVDCDDTVTVSIRCGNVKKTFNGGGAHSLSVPTYYATVKVAGKGQVRNLSLTCEVPNGI